MNPEITFLNPEIRLMGLKLLPLALIDGKAVQQNTRNGCWTSMIQQASSPVHAAMVSY